MSGAIKTVYAPGIDPFCWMKRKTAVRPTKKKAEPKARTRPYSPIPGSTKFRIAEIVRSKPGLNCYEIGKEMGVPHKTIISSLSHLVLEGMIERDCRGNRTTLPRYYPIGGRHAVS